MAVGLQVNDDKKKRVKKHARRTPEASPPTSDPAEGAALPTHVVGKMAEREPDDNAHRPREAPEAAERSEEGLDAGYARCSESSDFPNRGRDRS